MYDQYIKSLEETFKTIVSKLGEEMSVIRGNRPSVELVEHVRVSYMEQVFTVQQLGSITIQPPRDILIQVWDKSAVGPVMKAIEGAKIGLTTSNDGNVIRASLPSLTDERREEFTKLIKKTSENFRIQVRTRRDEVMKEMKSAGLNKDQEFKAKEKVQEKVDEANKKIEELVEKKLKEIQG